MRPGRRHSRGSLTAATRRYWPKGLAGNTHPGASLPHGMVSVTAYSGAYPSGYGINAQSCGGEPAAFQASAPAPRRRRHCCHLATSPRCTPQWFG